MLLSVLVLGFLYAHTIILLIILLSLSCSLWIYYTTISASLSNYHAIDDLVITHVTVNFSFSLSLFDPIIDNPLIILIFLWVQVALNFGFLLSLFDPVIGNPVITSCFLSLSISILLSWFDYAIDYPAVIMLFLGIQANPSSVSWSGSYGFGILIPHHIYMVSNSWHFTPSMFTYLNMTAHGLLSSYCHIILSIYSHLMLAICIHECLWYLLSHCLVAQSVHTQFPHSFDLLAHAFGAPAWLILLAWWPEFAAWIPSVLISLLCLIVLVMHNAHIYGCCSPHFGFTSVLPLCICHPSLPFASWTYCLHEYVLLLIILASILAFIVYPYVTMIAMAPLMLLPSLIHI